MFRIRLLVHFLLLTGAGLALAATTTVHSQSAAPSRDTSIYGHVTHVGWVVRDLDVVLAHWKRIGITDVATPITREFPGVMYRGKPTTVTVRSAVARVGDMTIEWVQPTGGRSLATEYLDRRGEGIHRVAYAVPSEERFEQELAAFNALGVDVVQSGSWQGEAGTGLFADLDTAPRGGGITIRLEVNPDAPRRSGATSANRDPFNKVTQYAFVVKDVKRVGAFYESLGFGPMPVDHNISLDRVYRGKPGVFEMYLGWGRGGSVTFEWIEPIVGPSVYHEFLAEKGEGFHHLGFNVTDMDAAIAQLRAAGLGVTMSGGWDTNGHQGRFAYFDAERVGGVSIELLWNKPQAKSD
jgi:methylmalonyl-CoA/ethylmalonyl-CoA epimerase